MSGSYALSTCKDLLLLPYNFQYKNSTASKQQQCSKIVSKNIRVLSRLSKKMHYVHKNNNEDKNNQPIQIKKILVHQ
jgi:hypothetical protein